MLSTVEVLHWELLGVELWEGVTVKDLEGDPE